MLIDLRSLENVSLTKDICIVGTGPAGLSLAREFIGQNLDVCLLESGGLTYDPQAQELADGFTVGEPIHPPISVCRRQLGGNSNSWVVRIAKNQLGVRYTPLDALDFEPRDWVPNSGWPIDYGQLVPYYQRAQQVCRSGPFTFEPSPWESDQARRLPLNEHRVQTGMFQFGPSNTFFELYRDEIAQSSNVTLYHHATAVEIEANESGQAATRLRVATLEGHSCWVSAKVFVLACGGFENARLLLMSNQQQPAGLGNHHGVVGRYFHDHPFVLGGQFIPANRHLFNQTALYDSRWVGGHPAMGHLKLSPAILKQEQLLNISASFFPRPSQRKMRSIESLQALVGMVGAKKITKELPEHLLRVLLGADHIAQTAYLVKTKNQPWLTGFSQGGWSELSSNERRFKTFEVIHQIEQSPDPANRVTLSRERDVLGCPKLEVHWRWNLEDARRIGRAQEIMAEELRLAGLGQFKIARDGDLPVLGRPSGAHHLMGTTRMHNDPKQGVVDAQCCVHGLSNLFVASSSVFPTGGYANPTLTIVALSLRLADLIKQELAEKQVVLNQR